MEKETIKNSDFETTIRVFVENAEYFAHFFDVFFIILPPNYLYGTRQKQFRTKLLYFIITHKPMKKFYVFLCTALLGFFFPTVLCASTVNVVIDDPERVIVEMNYTPVEGLVAGSNTLDIPEYTPVYIKAKEGCFLLSVVRESTGSNEYIYSYTSCYLSIGADETFTVTSAYADEIRDASCTITVDHASDVVVQRTGTYTNVDLVEPYADTPRNDRQQPQLAQSPRCERCLPEESAGPHRTAFQRHLQTHYGRQLRRAPS